MAEEGSSESTPVSVREPEQEGLTGRLFGPLGPDPAPGVLVLHGGEKGAYTLEYAELLAHHGYAALRLEYFDAPGLPDELAEVPLEYFERAIDWLVDRDGVRADRTGIVAWSRGSEAAFLVADADDRIEATVGYVPAAYAFPGPTEPVRSAWTRNGDPVPYVPPDHGLDDEAPPRRRFRRAVDRASPAERDRAALPVADIAGPVLLVSGADDRVWPSNAFAERLEDRLAERGHGGPVEHRTYADAGHGIAVPYDPLDRETLDRFGGTRAGTAYAAADAWTATLECLRRGLRR